KGRTDLAEMAQTAAVETINATVGPRAATLWGSGPEEVRTAFAALATPARFGAFARQFFARFSFKTINYFLSKVVAEHTGDGRRFPTVAEQSRFTDALRTHCREATAARRAPRRLRAIADRGRSVGGIPGERTARRSTGGGGL
ncbi:MAG TPA: hypothetical protein VM529_04145, partial [Gemmata sp.]|nr:hypothetical protein [Gemmata sp.]